MKSKEEIKKEAEERFWKWNGKDYMDNEITHLEKSKYVSGYLGGYTQCQEDIADKKYTEEDMISFAYQFSNINVSDFRKHLKDFDVNLKEKNKQ